MLLITNEMSLKEIIQNEMLLITNEMSLKSEMLLITKEIIQSEMWNVIDNKWNVIERNNTEVKCYW